MEEGDPWRHWYSTNYCGSPERGSGLPRIQSGGGRAVLDTGYNADMTYLVSRLWRIKDTKD